MRISDWSSDVCSSDLVSCMGGLNQCDCIPALTPYFVMKIGNLPLVPYHRPGDPHLGDAIRGLAAKHSAVLLANHGPVVSGTNLESAVYAMQGLEKNDNLLLRLHGHTQRGTTPVKESNTTKT